MPHCVCTLFFDTMHLVLTKERLFAMTTSLTIRMDDTLKAEAEDFFDDIGMNMTTAITCFFKKCLATGKIPFTLSRETKRERLLSAIREANEIANDPNAPYCDDPEKLEEFLFHEIHSQDDHSLQEKRQTDGEARQIPY